MKKHKPNVGGATSLPVAHFAALHFLVLAGDAKLSKKELAGLRALLDGGATRRGRVRQGSTYDDA